MSSLPLLPLSFHVSPAPSIQYLCLFCSCSACFALILPSSFLNHETTVVLLCIQLLSKAAVSHLDVLVLGGPIVTESLWHHVSVNNKVWVCLSYHKGVCLLNGRACRGEMREWWETNWQYECVYYVTTSFPFPLKSTLGQSTLTLTSGFQNITF